MPSPALPVLALRQEVAFPHVSFPVQVGRAGSVAALAAAQEGDGRLLALCQRSDTTDIDEADLAEFGTVLEVLQVEENSLGKQVLVRGIRRVRVLSRARLFHAGAEYLAAKVVEVPDLSLVDARDPATEALRREVTQRARALLEHRGIPALVTRQLLGDGEEPGALADVAAHFLGADFDRKQALLETSDVEERLRKVLALLEVELGVIEAQEKLRDSVKEEIGERQQEAFLREQMKAIRKQLGEDGSDRADEELRERLAKLPLPEEGRREVDRALRRLGSGPREGAEAQVLRTWLETVADLPWDVRSDETLDVEHARDTLEADHHGLDDVKERVLEFLAVRQMRARREPPAEAEDAPEGAPPMRHRDAPGPILLFVGPPGTGKTSVAESIARSLGREYVRIALGGVRDEADVRGHRRTYVGAMPGRILDGLRRAGTRNPVVCLDEVDKLGAGYQGNPASALLEVLDPAQNHAFTDHYLGIPFDLSEVLFVCTANFLQGIPGPLMDRMERIDFGGYTEAEKSVIARKFLLPRAREAAGLDEAQFTVTDDALARVIAEWTREAGLRQLTRELKTLARKAALRLASGEEETIHVDGPDVRARLGRPRARPEQRLEADEIGVSTGMYYTPAGGDVMFVEVSTMPGKERLVLTGQLGDVMKESAQAAWTYARSNTGALGLDPARIRDQDLHLHVPAGAVPKDGPSAGCAIATAVVSALSDRPVRADVAMTGEVTLRGRVLPIGGVKEKVLGALRAGITTVLIPKANEDDLEDLPEEALAKLTVHCVGHLDEVFAHALHEKPRPELKAVR
jgi:ATP-dependent Lon protease